ncbi:Fe transporter [Lineolata rhizophorae]|uniref:Fe transporter n=1 Tax=Lineolata rhizophorae TaxID=578093 RepID=A0A6A6NXP8_9PEZI|nr:Fe transporter [Lineolata rhizophorae]
MADRPQCGGGELDADNYDLPLHVAAVFLVLGASVFGAGFPVVAKKIPSLKIPAKVFFYCKHFGTGVLIATAFAHLLPTAFGSLNDPCLPPLFTEQYPALPGAIMMGSLFVLFVIELWLNGKVGGHSHGGPTGSNTHAGHQNKSANRPNISAPVPIKREYSFSSDASTEMGWDEKTEKTPYVEENEIPPLPAERNFDESNMPSEMPAWFIVFYEQYVRQREDMLRMINDGVKKKQEPVTTHDTNEKQMEPSLADVESGEVDPLVLKKMNLNITLLEGGILFHSIFVGMTVSITTDGFIVLLIAILFHQMFEGLGLGSRIAAVPYPKGNWRPWLLVLAFGTTAPIGQAIGLATRNTYDPDSAFGLIIVGVFNAISSGLLIYAALVDLLAEDFLSEEANMLLTTKDKVVAFTCVLFGAAGMSFVGAFA